MKVRKGGSEEIPLVQGKKQWLRFAGAAVKRYTTPKVRETQVRWLVLQEGIRRQTPAGMLLPSCPHRRNLVEEVDARYMKTCLFHKTLHPLCPVFKLGYVVQESGQNFSTLAEKV